MSASKLKLKDWGNKDKVGTRFPPSRQTCPRCRERVLLDTWPPNYGGGSSTISLDGSSSRHESYGSQKFVCIPCKIAFHVSYTETVIHIDDGTFLGKEKTDREVVVSEPVDLAEKDGYLLTPHDVWREKVKEETGEYPIDAYN